MIQLHPKETFTITRQIEDHTDSGTYYVQAVVRNAKTDALIATVNLDDKGGRRFTKSYIVPADPSGEGVWISILTSVYTDAGYTTKSQNYADKMESYLVQARPVFNPNYPVPTGGGSDINYQKIRQIIAEEIKNMTTGDKFKVSEFEPFVKAIRSDVASIGTLVGAIKLDPINFQPVLSAITEEGNIISSKIASMDSSRMYADLTDKLSSITKTITEIEQKVNEPVDDLPIDVDKLVSAIHKKGTEHYEKALEIETKFKEFISMIEGNKEKEEAPEDKEYKKARINKLIKK